MEGVLTLFFHRIVEEKRCPKIAWDILIIVYQTSDLTEYPVF